MKIKPMKDWILCEALEADFETPSGLILSKNQDKEVMSEGVAKVIEANIPGWTIQPGEYLVYRGHLRFANQLGNLYEESRGCKVFLLHYKDALCTVEGPCTVGKYSEFRIPAKTSGD